MGDVNHQHINGNVTEVNGIKIEKLVIAQDTKPFPRNQYIREILTLRSSCKHLEFIINTHAEKCYGSRYFKEMPEDQLTEMHQFVMQLKQAVEKREMPSLVRWVIKKLNILLMKGR